MSLEADIIVSALSELASSKYRLLKSQDSLIQNHVADLESNVYHSSVLPPHPPADCVTEFPGCTQTKILTKIGIELCPSI